MSGNDSFKGTKNDCMFTNINATNILASYVSTSTVSALITSNVPNSSVYTSNNLSIVPSGTLTITPTSDNHIVQLAQIDNSGGQVDFTLDVDTTSSNLNDLLIVMLTISNPGTNIVNMSLSNNFYYIFNGVYAATTDIENFQRLVIQFTFDGTKFVNI
jgi:hypothetical protein